MAATIQCLSPPPDHVKPKLEAEGPWWLGKPSYEKDAIEWLARKNDELRHTLPGWVKIKEKGADRYLHGMKPSDRSDNSSKRSGEILSKVNERAARRPVAVVPHSSDVDGKIGRNRHPRASTQGKSVRFAEKTDACGSTGIVTVMKTKPGYKDPWAKVER